MAYLKHCWKCDEWKPLDEFKPPYSNRNARGGKVPNKTCYTCLYGGKGFGKNMITAFRGIKK